MHREIEAKILDIDPEKVQEKLRALGAALEEELDLEQVVWWAGDRARSSIRVRRSSDGIVRIIMKRDASEGLGYHEWECDVSDYETAIAIVDALVSVPDLRIEFSHHRQDWRLDGALINIDWFPKIAPLVEIEAESEEKIRSLAEKLGFNPSLLVNKGVVSLLYEALGLKKGDRVKI
ncbi:MAG: Uncharacterized protein G01um101433_615 [Parcubacteria group bacterium Gr01-1014_33]|nr:MAG: Uncharacterized protein G01um101433_615 [Parcubacteria group bacterium Gr01-1014_33]